MCAVGKTDMGVHIALRVDVDTLKVEDVASWQNDLVLDGGDACLPLVFVFRDGCVRDFGCVVLAMLQCCRRDDENWTVTLTYKTYRCHLTEDGNVMEA
jgi:hypothetical protein